MTEVERKNSDEVSVEDEAYGDTDENIVRAVSSGALKPDISQSKIVNHIPNDSMRIK